MPSAASQWTAETCGRSSIPWRWLEIVRLRSQINFSTGAVQNQAFEAGQIHCIVIYIRNKMVYQMKYAILFWEILLPNISNNWQTSSSKSKFPRRRVMQSRSTPQSTKNLLSFCLHHRPHVRKTQMILPNPNFQFGSWPKFVRGASN